MSTSPIWYPLPHLLPELEAMAENVVGRVYDFTAEESEIAEISFSLLEVPEDSLHEFNVLYAQVQSYSSRVAAIIIQVYREKSWWQKQLYVAKKLYRKARTTYLRGPEVRALKNKELQEAYVHEQIAELVDLKELIEEHIDSLDLLIDTFQIRKEDLDKANTNLSRQQKVVESLIGIGYPVRGSRHQSQE